MRLLIADDEVNLAKALQAVLEDAGYNCDVCFDGNSAIRLISQEIYDGLILDIMMPGMSGLRTCEEIRKVSNVPVLFLTAKGEIDDKSKGFEAGADEANLVEGSKIRRTQSAVVLENLISQFLYSKAEDGGK